jgi:hypothetical protein
MKHILLATSIILLCACGGGSSEKGTNIVDLPVDEGGFTLQNVRFDSYDYYEGEYVTITEGTTFEVQWVSPASESYSIDLYLSTSGEVHSDRNKIVGLLSHFVLTQQVKFNVSLMTTAYHALLELTL